MNKFTQIHMLTSYPPANLNRDDLGRPKTAIMGGTQRLRISSQSLKRAWRTSEVFENALSQYMGTRTKLKGVDIFNQLCSGGIPEGNAKDWTKEIAGKFGKLKGQDKKKSLEELEIEQLAHFSPEEIKGIDSLVKKLINEKRAPAKEELDLLRAEHQSADIALFGRMLASSPDYNMDAACQVAHAITVHKVTVEDDYFTAVDDLNKGKDDMGAAHLGETEFAAGVFYLYICIDNNLLQKNLNNDKALTEKTVCALIESAATVAPSGKQNSFASRAYASFILAERGDRQPRSLSVAFLKPVNGGDIEDAIKAMTNTRENIDKVYGNVTSSCTMNAVTGEGNLGDILNFVIKIKDEDKND